MNLIIKNIVSVMKTKFFALIGILFSICSMVKAEGDISQRPPIIGVAHIGFYTKDLDHTRSYLRDFMGYDETVTLEKMGKYHYPFLK